MKISQPFIVGVVMCLIQFLAALPWLAVIDPAAFKSTLRRPLSWLIAAGGVLAGGIGLAFFIIAVQDPIRLQIWGRAYGALLQIQLAVDVLALLFPLLLFIWPQGGAVALAAFRESVRQPLYWLISGAALLGLLVSIFLPYFTFGEDYKMVLELGFDMTMLSGVVFSVVAASMSIAEEIEGRSAITVMSKPVSRRQFLLGKFVGILLAAYLMTALLGWVFNGVMWAKYAYDSEPMPDPSWLIPMHRAWIGMVGYPLNFGLGAGIWFDQMFHLVPGLLFGFCQVMVLLSIAVALATRLPMIVNLVTCIVIFFLGHLTNVLVHGDAARYKLVKFAAEVFNIILPGLDYFDLTALLVRDAPPDPTRFVALCGSIVLYAMLYSLIALLFGLILFEDRDLA